MHCAIPTYCMSCFWVVTEHVWTTSDSFTNYKVQLFYLSLKYITYRTTPTSKPFVLPVHYKPLTAGWHTQWRITLIKKWSHMANVALKRIKVSPLLWSCTIVVNVAKCQPSPMQSILLYARKRILLQVLAALNGGQHPCNHQRAGIHIKK